jgi:hypothetical protein
VWWHIPVIPATREAEVGGLRSEASHRQKLELEYYEKEVSLRERKGG